MKSEKTKTISPPQFNISGGFADWLKEANGSLVFTARRLGKVYTVGLDDKDEVVFFERSYPDPTGLSVNNNTLIMADKFRIWRFENGLTPNTQHPFEGFDAVYVPEMMYRTGNQDTHELGLLKSGMIAFASTRMNCVGGCVATHAIAPLWKPSFIDSIVYEDRCHLNGLALENGMVKYITALSQTNTFEGWRDVRADGGVLIDVSNGEIILDDLSMPHSPRLHDGNLWIVNSGTGEIGIVDKANKIFTARARIPGFARGLQFIGDTAITGTSKFRESKSFQDLPLEASLKNTKQKDQCGLFVFDTLKGDILHSITVENKTIEEIYDVVFVPGVKHMMISGLNDDLSEQMITIAPARK